jgi:hypothetical protein
MKSGTEEREGTVKQHVKQQQKPVLGAKARLNKKPTGKNKEKMGPHQYATRLFNAEVNLASDWVIEQKSQLLKQTRYICRYRRIIVFL